MSRGIPILKWAPKARPLAKSVTLFPTERAAGSPSCNTRQSSDPVRSPHEMVGKPSTWTVDWSPYSPEETYSDLTEALRRTADGDARRKWRNTLEFFEFRRDYWSKHDGTIAWRKVYLVRFLTQPGQAQLTQLGYPRRARHRRSNTHVRHSLILTRSAFTSSGLRTG